MAADLEGLYQHYRAAGDTEDEAVRRAEEKVLASREVIQRLVAVHSTGYARWAARVSGTLRDGIDAGLLIIALLPMLAVGAVAALPQFGVVRSAGFFWVSALLAGLLAAISLAKAAQLWRPADRPPAELHYALFTLLYLALLAPVAGLLAALIGLRSAASGWMAAGHDWPAAAADWVARDASLFALSVLLALGGGLAWWVLMGRIARIEQTESAILLGYGDEGPAAPRPPSAFPTLFRRQR